MYKIFLSYNNNEEVIELPVLPEKIEISHKGNNKSAEILSLGEITQQKLPKAFTIQISSEFPSSYHPGIGVNKLYNPTYYIKTIENWRLKLRPIRLVFTGGTVEINSPVTIEDFTYTEKAGDVGTWEYKISLKQYQFYAAEKIYLDNNSNSSKENIDSTATIIKSRQNTREIPRTYTIQRGDTLSKISRKIFGTDDGYWTLVRLNGLSDSDIKSGLPVGKVLRVY